MSNQNAYRHEWKHEINRGDLWILRQRLSAVTKRDPHAVDGVYHVRSLYFDTASDKALREKMDGVNRREKFRIRCYNKDVSLLRLEKKSKINGLCRKQSAILQQEQVRQLLAGDMQWMRDSQDPLVLELYSKMYSQGLRPKTIVDYTREPFVFALGNVRVTLDYDICTGLSQVDFLNPDCVMVRVEREPILLEVKWDAYLPEIIRDVVQLPGRRAGAFSKYAACRGYDYL